MPYKATRPSTDIFFFLQKSKHQNSKLNRKQIMKDTYKKKKSRNNKFVGKSFIFSYKMVFGI